MDSYLKKVVFDSLLESYYFNMKKEKKRKKKHGLLLYYFLTTVDNVLGSYSVATIAKFLIEPLLKCLTFPANSIMSFKYPFKKLIKTYNLLYNCKVAKIVFCCRIIFFLHELLMYIAYVMGKT